MELDLFTIVERFFSGVIQFLFNLVESVVILVRHSNTGPRFLWRRYLNPKLRQVGPNTLLLLSLLPGQVLAVALIDFFVESGASQHDSLDEALKKLVAQAEISDFILRPLVGALTVAVIIDALLRLRMLRQHRRSQDDQVPVTKYRAAGLSLLSSFVLALYVGIGILIVWESSTWLGFIAFLAFPVVVLLLPFICFLLLPRRFRLLRRLALPGVIIVLMSIGAGTQAIVVFDALNGPDPAAYTKRPRNIGITVLAIACRLADAVDPRVDLVLYNQTRDLIPVPLDMIADVRWNGQDKNDVKYDVSGLDLRANDGDGLQMYFLPLDSHKAVALTLRPRDQIESKKVADAYGAAGRPVYPTERCTVRSGSHVIYDSWKVEHWPE